MVICLERGADLHTAQLMPLSLTVSCFNKIQIGFTFLVPAYPGSPGQRAAKQVCVCVGELTIAVGERTSLSAMRLVSVLICLRLGMSATWPPTACPYLGSGDEEEAAGEKKSLHRGLHIAELDSIQVENTLTVGQDQCVQCENLEHLEGRHQRTSALLNDVTHCSTHTHNTHTCETMHIQCISNVRLKQYNISSEQ